MEFKNPSTVARLFASVAEREKMAAEAQGLTVEAYRARERERAQKKADVAERYEMAKTKMEYASSKAGIKRARQNERLRKVFDAIEKFNPCKEYNRCYSENNPSPCNPCWACQMRKALEEG